MEKTLNEALSGSEIKEIIAQEIMKRMNGDTTLANDLAYAGFTVKFNLDISFHRSMTKPTQVWGDADEKTPVIVPAPTAPTAPDAPLAKKPTFPAPIPDLKPYIPIQPNSKSTLDGDAVDRAIATALAGLHTSADSPDIERQNHDLAVPVMIKTPSGTERRKVRIERQGK